jgi:hypothetical protein
MADRIAIDRRYISNFDIMVIHHPLLNSKLNKLLQVTGALLQKTLYIISGK